MTALPQALVSSASQEWRTPPWLIDAARVVLGHIDLDPASTPEANSIVRAERIFTNTDDGLSMDWYGTVWCNPPYGCRDGKSNQMLWSKRMAEAFHRNEIHSGLLLVTAKLAERWFQNLRREMTAVCFLAGRVRFLDASGQPQTRPTQSHCVAAFLRTQDGLMRFVREFENHGWVIVP